WAAEVLGETPEALLQFGDEKRIRVVKNRRWKFTLLPGLIRERVHTAGRRRLQPFTGPVQLKKDAASSAGCRHRPRVQDRQQFVEAIGCGQGPKQFSFNSMGG